MLSSGSLRARQIPETTLTENDVCELCANEPNVFVSNYMERESFRAAVHATGYVLVRKPATNSYHLTSVKHLQQPQSHPQQMSSKFGQVAVSKHREAWSTYAQSVPHQCAAESTQAMIPSVQRLFDAANNNVTSISKHDMSLISNTSRTANGPQSSHAAPWTVEDVSAQVGRLHLDGAPSIHTATPAKETQPRSGATSAAASKRDTAKFTPGQSRPRRVTRRTNAPLPATPTTAAPSPSVYATLDCLVKTIYANIRPEFGETKRRERLLAHMNKIVRSEWCGAKVEMFGSGANGLNLRMGDVDMCLMVQRNQTNAPCKHCARVASKVDSKCRGDSAALSDKQIMKRMSELLRRARMRNVRLLLSARVPIIKLSDPISGFQVDFCLNNELVHHNTMLLQQYVRLDPRVHQLCLIVKYWTKQRAINDTYRGTLSSYAYILLLINYLQILPVPVLPCLQLSYNGVTCHPDAIPKQNVLTPDGRTCNVYFDATVNQFHSENRESVGELLIGFLEHFAFTFNFREDVVCPRLGTLLSRKEKHWDEATVAKQMADAVAEAELKSAVAHDIQNEGERVANDAYARSDNFDQEIVPFDDENFPALGSDRGSGSRKTDPKKISSSSLGAQSREVRKTSSDDEQATGQTTNDSNENSHPRSGTTQGRLPRYVVKHVFCIEDPFDLAHDLGRSIDEETLSVIRYEFIRARDILALTGNVHEMLEKYVEVETSNS